jgi:hypothetical protein
MKKKLFLLLIHFLFFEASISQSTEDYEYNYLNWNFTNAGGASNFSNTMRYVLNSRVDTNKINFTYSAKRISQIYNSMPYGALQTGEVIEYDITKAQFTLDTLFINAISVRENKNTTDTFVVKIGHTTIGAGGYTRSYDSISNVIYLKTERVILGPNDSIENYTYAGLPIVFPIGAVPVIILEYFSSVDSNGISIAHSKNIKTCASATSILSNQNRYGISDYVGVVRFSDGPSRLSFYGNSILNIPDEVPCNYYETQTWGIFPKGKVTLDPQVNIVSSQSSAVKAKFCLGDTVNLFANLTGVPGNPDSTKYTWTPATDLSNATIANPVATIGAASRTYTVTAVNGALQASANVTVSSASLTATFPNTVTLTSCVDTNKSITVQVTGPTTIGTTPLQRSYTWSSGQTTTTPTLTKVKQGSYTVTVSNGLCNTTATTEVKLANNVAVNQLSFDIDPAEPCQNKEVVFTNTSSESDKWKYLWKNGTSTFSTLYEPANYKFPTAGNSIRVTLESTLGACFTKLEKIIKVLDSSDSKCQTLIIDSVIFSTINKVICQGESFLNRTISGTYIDTIKKSNINGLDSIRTLNLTVNPKAYSVINQTICQGASFMGRAKSGTYVDTLKGLNSFGCDSIRTLNLTVIDKPLISGVISGPTTVCQGQSNLSYSVIEASNNPTKYNWSLPNGFNGVSNTNKIPVNILSNAISGILTVMSENTCGNSNILSLPVIVNPKPQKPIISNNGNSLISSSLNGNQWYDLNGLIAGANNTVYIGTPNNSYYVLVTENGCISDPSNIISLSSSEVVELLNKGIKIYPNPFSELLNIEVSHKDHIEYLLTTVDGKVINKDKFKEHYKIDTKKLASGTYFLIIKNKNQSESFKIIKK